MHSPEQKLVCLCRKYTSHLRFKGAVSHKKQNKIEIQNSLLLFYNIPIVIILMPCIVNIFLFGCVAFYVCKETKLIFSFVIKNC